MRIKIKKDANLQAIHACNIGPINWHWAEVMQCISGEWLEVETKFLFGGQFNTAGLDDDSINILVEKIPEHRHYMIPKIRESLKMGLRIIIRCVEKIEGDVRGQYVKCHYCGECFNKEWAHLCDSKYIETFDRHLKYQKKLYVENNSEYKITRRAS